MNKKVKNWLRTGGGLAMLACSTVALSQAVPAPECTPDGTVVAVFNGVRTTQHDANVATLALERRHGVKTADGKEVRYDVMYNAPAGLANFVDAFEQRLGAQNGLLSGKFELFFETLGGDGRWWTSIIEAVGSTAQIRDVLTNQVAAQSIGQLTALLAKPPAIADYPEQLARLNTYAAQGRKVVMFAHSQGNLFASSAYAHVTTKLPTNAVQVVHVAPPGTTLHGAHVLANRDQVIEPLHKAGAVRVPNVVIPIYLTRPPGENAMMDPLGHGLLEIYMNPKLEIGTSLDVLVREALTNAVTPPACVAGDV